MENADAWLQYLATLQAMIPRDEETVALANVALGEYVAQLVAVAISDKDQADRCKWFQRASDQVRERLEDLAENEL